MHIRFHISKAHSHCSVNLSLEGKKYEREGISVIRSSSLAHSIASHFHFILLIFSPHSRKRSYNFSRAVNLDTRKYVVILRAYNTRQTNENIFRGELRI